jgi:5-methylcytosine-specific restriction enzyme subunit McrC
VATQESRRFWRARPLPARTVRPDLVVRDRASGAPVLVVDTKWKLLGGSAGVPADDDLKQMFVYNELFGAPRSVLVYPAVDAGAHRLEGEYFERAHRCGSVELGLFEGAELGTGALIEQVAWLLAQVNASASPCPQLA